MRSISIIVILLIVFPLSCDRAAAGLNEPKVIAVNGLSSEQRSLLMKLDFTEAIKKTGFISPTEEEISQLVRKAFKGPFTKPLTDSEKRLLGHWIISDKCLLSMDAMLTLLVRFYNQHNKFPEDGTEFISKLNLAQFELFLAKDRNRQLQQVFVGINPVTGHFRERFSGQWNPGGIAIEKCSDPQIVDKYAKMFKDKNSGGPVTVWSVVIYGEARNSVLARTYLMTNAELSFTMN